MNIRVSAAILPCLLFTSLSAVGQVNNFRAGTWEISEHSNFCFASANTLRSASIGLGVTFLKFVATERDMALMLNNSNWKMSLGKTAKADIFVDGEQIGKATGEVYSKNGLDLKIPNDQFSRWFEKFQSGDTLKIQFDLREYEFDLRDSRRGLAGLLQCAANKIARNNNAGPSAQPSHDTAESSLARRLSSGSGFYVSNQGHILTADHVIAGCKQIEVVDRGPANMVRRDPSNDLALIRIADRTDHYATFSGPPVEHAEKILVIGYPFSDHLRSSLNVTTGIVSSLTGLNGDTRYVQVSAAVQPGNSGGPLMNESGHVIGVVSAKLDQIEVAKISGAIPENIAWALRNDIIFPFMKLAQIDPSISTQNETKDDKEIARVAADIVVLIRCSR